MALPKTEGMKEMVKRNLLKMVVEHRENCPGQECTIVLEYARTLGEWAGLSFTEEEVKLFW